MVSYVDELTIRLAGVEIAPCEFPEPDAPVYLSGAVNPVIRSVAADHPNLGVLVQPGTDSYRLIVNEYSWWAADNGCFAKGDSFDVDGWLRWVEGIAADEALRSTCLFVVCPDVVGDAAGTIARSAPILPLVRKLGLPAAFAAQDGLELLDIPWDTFDVLFIGGSTEWKLGPEAAQIAKEARHRGKWVHMGRVNSWKRCHLARLSHADSVDGTFLAFGPTKNWPRLESWLLRYAADAEAATVVTNTVVRPPSVVDYMPTLELT